MNDDDFHLDLFSQLGELHDGIDVTIPESTASFHASSFAETASLVAPLAQQPGFTSQSQQHTLPVMAMPAQPPAFGAGPMNTINSQAALVQAQMQLQQIQSVLGQQTSGGSFAGGPSTNLLSRPAQKAAANALPPGPAAIIENGRVLCCYCAGKSICCGGSTRGLRYKYLCENCGQRWTQLIEPNAAGDYEVMPSNFKIGDEQRRSGGYACGKCGAKPKFGHICPFKDLDAGDAIAPRSLDPLAPTSTPEQSTAEHAALEAITTAQKIITEQQVNESEEELVERLQSESADPIPLAAGSWQGMNDGGVPTAWEGNLKDDEDDDLLAGSDPTPATQTDPTVNPKLADLEKVPEPDMESLTNGHSVLKLLQLVRYKVRGDGSCWIYAVLAAAGLLDSLHVRVEIDPSDMDRAKDLLCRVLCNKWLHANGASVLNLSAEEMASIDDILKTPEYPFTDEENFGTFGTNVTIAALVALIKVTVVLWNKKTLQNINARQQVIEFIPATAETTETIKERIWDNTEICEYALKNKTIHIEWNGSNHYAAFVPAKGVQIDPAFAEMLCNQKPVTRQKVEQTKKRKTEDESDGWIHMINHRRPEHDPVNFTKTKWAVDTPIDTLKADCRSKNFNAILIFNKAIHYTSYAWKVTADDCLEAVDHSCELYVFNGTKRKKAPTSGCTCNKVFKKNTHTLQCQTCGRWCHHSCTHVADLSLAKISKLERFDCSVCSS